jgi:two-component system, NtrC family, nitrogen regulation response regulator NtrX
MAETILIVDDEDSVRKTFADWLNSSSLGCEVHAVGDSESALLIANQGPIDLAVLDWNLGTGSDGLRLLEDLVEFHPDIVAILITGYAHQATPLQALRMGVRDYLDKNQDLNRETFLGAVSRQLNRIIPAKQQRQFNQRLLLFRESIEKILPLVQATSSLNDPVPLSQAIQSLLRFTQRVTLAKDGVLLIRNVTETGAETTIVHDLQGKRFEAELVTFGESLAATALSMQECCIINQMDADAVGNVQLQPFEKNRSNVLLAPINLGNHLQAVLELFDKPDRFTDEDRRFVSSAMELGSSLLQQSFADRRMQSLLFAAVEEALRTSNELMESSLPGSATQRMVEPPSEPIMDRLREGLAASPSAVIPGEELVKLAEAIRVLAIRHGTPAIRHCLQLIESLRDLLDESYSGMDR